jgi:hypothetical protein
LTTNKRRFTSNKRLFEPDKRLFAADWRWFGLDRRWFVTDWQGSEADCEITDDHCRWPFTIGRTMRRRGQVPIQSKALKIK